MDEEAMAPSGANDSIIDTDVGDAPEAGGGGDELDDLLSEGDEEEVEGDGGLDEEAPAELEAEAGQQPPGGPPQAAAEEKGVSTGSGSQQHEGTGVKLFLGGLSWDTTEDTLRQHFSDYGEVVKVEIMTDRHTGNPRGFGFVTLADENVAEEVCRLKHIIDGRQIDAKHSVPQGSHAHRPPSRKIFVGGLAPDTTDEQFREYFSQFGAVSEAQIMQDHASGRSRGFGFVTFEEESAVEQVFQEGYMHTLAGKKVEVKTATPRGGAGHMQHGGGRGGGGRNQYGGSSGGGHRGKSESYGSRGGGGGYGESRGTMMGGMQGQPGGMMGGMMGGYPMAGYGMGGYGMGFPGPYGAYSGMMLQQMGAYGYGVQGYGGNFGYPPMGYAGGMQQEQQGSPGPNAGGGADQQQGQGSRYHPYARSSP